MKKIMKKMAGLCMAMLMVSQLVACGGGNATNGDDSGANNNQENVKTEGETNLSWEEIKAQIPEELKGTTVTVYNWNDANLATGSVMAIQKFEEETGIKVKWVTGSYESYATDIAAMVTANEAPDIVRLRDTDFSMLKLLTPLDEVDYDFTDKAWNQDIMYEYQVNGKQYAVALDDTPYVNPLIMYYNRSLISKYNLEDPYELWKKGEWTWDKCMEMCETFLDAAGTNFNGLSLYMGADYASSLGTSFFSYEPETSQYVSHMSDTALVKGWQFVADNARRGLIMTNVYQTTFLEKGLLLFCNVGSIGARTTHNYFVEMKENGELGTVPVPSVEGQDTYYQYLTELEAYGIPQGAKNPEGAAYFLRYYLDAANYDMNSFYCDDQAAEVVNWCMQQEVTTNVHRVIYEDQYGASEVGMAYKLMTSDLAQIKTHLDTFSPIIDTVVKDGNEVLSGLSKGE